MSSGRYLFVSDLHLDGQAPQAVATFIAFLRGAAHGAQALFILGDLFETWIGDDDDEPARTAICDALLEYTALTPCYVQRGNRDFLLGAGFERRSGCRLLADPVRVQLGARVLLLSHGDVLCTADLPYQRFRNFTRQASTQRRFLSLPLATRRALARAARAGSRAHTQGQPGRIMDVDPQTVAALLRIGAADLLIHGHTHRPAVHGLMLDGRPATRIVLGDWYDEGSYLALDAEGHYETLRLARPPGSTLSMEASSSRV
jgi:UDP-2,3-diacylglucosamine hydrolase